MHLFSNLLFPQKIFHVRQEIYGGEKTQKKVASASPTKVALACKLRGLHSYDGTGYQFECYSHGLIREKHLLFLYISCFDLGNLLTEFLETHEFIVIRVCLDLCKYC